MRSGRYVLASYGAVMSLVLIGIFCGDAGLCSYSSPPEISGSSIASAFLDLVGLWLFVGLTSVSLRKLA